MASARSLLLGVLWAQGKREAAKVAAATEVATVILSCPHPPIQASAWAGAAVGAAGAAVAGAAAAAAAAAAAGRAA